MNKAISKEKAKKSYFYVKQEIQKKIDGYKSGIIGEINQLLSDNMSCHLNLYINGANYYGALVGKYFEILEVSKRI